MSGTITMLWSNSGARFRQDSSLRIGAGGGMNLKTWTIFDGKSLYVAMPPMPGSAGAGTRVMRMKLPPNALASMPGSIGMPGMSGLNAAQGKGRFKLWMWQSLPLRADIQMLVNPRGRRGAPGATSVRVSMRATSLNTSARPSPALFRLPAGSQVQDVRAPARR